MLLPYNCRNSYGGATPHIQQVSPRFSFWHSGHPKHGIIVFNYINICARGTHPGRGRSRNWKRWKSEWKWDNVHKNWKRLLELKWGYRENEMGEHSGDENKGNDLD